MRVFPIFSLMMPVNLIQYRGTVGMFNNRRFASSSLNYSYFSKKYHNYDTFTLAVGLIILTFCHLINVLSNWELISRFLPDLAGICNFSRKILYLSMIGIYLHHIWLSLTIIRLSDDIEENPGPKRNSFSICHWNLNSITAHNYLKVSLLRFYISLHNFDVVCISETYLDSTTALDDESLHIAGYNLLRADHASNSKRGGVCVYYKSSLALRLIDVHYLQECLIFEILIGGKSCNFISLYRSPSQSSDSIEEFADNLQLSLDKISNQNPFLTVVLGDFNTKSSNWYKHDQTTYEGSKMDVVTSKFGLQQLIKEPTHILGNSSSCIGLIFTSQPSLVMEWGVHLSLHSNCHQQITYAKFNLKIHYPPPYERETWHYQKANIDQIRKAIEQFPWDRSFKYLEVNEMAFLFNRPIKNILSNYIPHEIVICDDRDPPWINNRIKEIIYEKNDTFQCYLHGNKDPKLFNKVEYLQNELKSLIEANKEKYYSRISKRMINPLTSTKTYWSILKSFLNNKKIPSIPPLFHQNRYITKYKDKTELFNNFFANQCSLITYSSVLPSVLFKRTENVISSIDFGSDDIAKIIQNLDPNKAHGHDMISIRMLKICGNSIYKPLQ